mgnify:CR=1 FL=1
MKKLTTLLAVLALCAGAAFAQRKSKTLIIYYSWSGNTRTIATLAQKKTGADIAEIFPDKEYPANYTDCTAVAKEEQRRGEHPAVKAPLPDVSGYDTVILAYPLWWSDVPMFFYTLLESLDLSGKTVIPICSNGGSGLAQSVATIKRLAPKATVKNGLSIYRDGGSSLDKTLSDYLKKSGL